MEKFMRNAPSVVVFIAMLIQVPRISAFGNDIGAGFLAPVFAVFLGVSIYVLSYWHGRTDYKITANAETEKAKFTQQSRMKLLNDDLRSQVGFWLTLFVIIEGLLNLAETLTHIKSGVTFLSWQWFGAFAYGIFPTMAAFGMGSIQAKLHRIPHGVANASALEAMFNSVMRRIASYVDEDGAQGASVASQNSQGASHGAKSGRNLDAYPKPCPHGCGASMQNANALSAHYRYCPNIKKQSVANQFLIPTNEIDNDPKSTNEKVEKLS